MVLPKIHFDRDDFPFFIFALNFKLMIKYFSAAKYFFLVRDFVPPDELNISRMDFTLNLILFLERNK